MEAPGALCISFDAILTRFSTLTLALLRQFLWFYLFCATRSEKTQLVMMSYQVCLFASFLALGDKVFKALAMRGRSQIVSTPSVLQSSLNKQAGD